MQAVPPADRLDSRQLGFRHTRTRAQAHAGTQILFLHPSARPRWPSPAARPSGASEAACSRIRTSPRASAFSARSQNEREVPKEMTQLQWKLLTLDGLVSPPPPHSIQPQPAWRQTPTLWVSRTKPEQVSAQPMSQGMSNPLRLCFEVSWAFLELGLFQIHPFAAGRFPAHGSGDGVST